MSATPPNSPPAAQEQPAASASLVAELTDLLGSKVAASVARVLLALVEGSSLEDACTIADFSAAEFDLLCKKHDLVARQVERSRLKYKDRLLKAVRGDDKTMDGKTAMWLLERAFPEEYGPNARKPDESVSKKRDVMREAFAFIRANPKPLVNPSAGLPFGPDPKQPSGPSAEEAAAARANLERVMSNQPPA